jgi:hypothetical protein
MEIKKEALNQEPPEDQMERLFQAWQKGGKAGLTKAIYENELKAREPEKK